MKKNFLKWMLIVIGIIVLLGLAFCAIVWFTVDETQEQGSVLSYAPSNAEFMSTLGSKIGKVLGIEAETNDEFKADTSSKIEAETNDE